MQALLDVTLPVFLVIGFGWLATRLRLFTDAWVEGLMRFTQSFAIPALLFRAISTLELGQNFSPRLLLSFYAGAALGFLAGMLGARLLFRRPWPDSVAIGFACLFSNSVLLGLPITERAFGSAALGPNYAIIALHSPFCYALGITVMEIVRHAGRGVLRSIRGILAAMLRNALVLAIILGFAANLGRVPIPGVLVEALDMLVRAALPAALFGLGGVLARYRIRGELGPVGWIALVSLGLHPAVTWTLGQLLGLAPGPMRSAVVTAAMPPGVNTYIFANMYGVAHRVAASAVLIATAVSVLTASAWIALLGG